MTFVRGLSSIFPGMGQPQINPGQPSVVANTALTSGQGTITVPATGSFSPTISAGRVRVKVYAGIGTAPVLSDIVCSATDGTTTVTFAAGAYHPSAAVALSTTGIVEFEFEFITDLNLNVFTIKVTIGGTSPGATCDVEVLGVI